MNRTNNTNKFYQTIILGYQRSNTKTNGIHLLIKIKIQGYQNSNMKTIAIHLLIKIKIQDLAKITKFLKIIPIVKIINKKIIKLKKILINICKMITLTISLKKYLKSQNRSTSKSKRMFKAIATSLRLTIIDINLKTII